MQEWSFEHQESAPAAAGALLFVTENHAIVAWLKRGFADERKQTRGDRRICVKGSLREGAPAKRVREHA